MPERPSVAACSKLIADQLFAVGYTMTEQQQIWSGMQAFLRRQPNEAPTVAYKFHVIFPNSASGKYPVDPQYILETQGKEKYMEEADTQGALPANSKDYSVCMNFQNGSCTQNRKCHQLHVDPTWYADFKERVARTCCGSHGDFGFDNDAELREKLANLTFIITDAPPASAWKSNMVTAASALGCTHGLRKQITRCKSKQLTISIRDICRKHITKECRYGPDCNRIHVCRDVCDKLALPTVPPRKSDKVPPPLNAPFESAPAIQAPLAPALLTPHMLTPPLNAPPIIHEFSDFSDSPTTMERSVYESILAVVTESNPEAVYSTYATDPILLKGIGSHPFSHLHAPRMHIGQK